jgi:hypothetical protein
VPVRLREQIVVSHSVRAGRQKPDRDALSKSAGNQSAATFITFTASKPPHADAADLPNILRNSRLAAERGLKSYCSKLDT